MREDKEKTLTEFRDAIVGGSIQDFWWLNEPYALVILMDDGRRIVIGENVISVGDIDNTLNILIPKWTDGLPLRMVGLNSQTH